MALEGKTVLLTGASKGIGKELAFRLAEERANIGLVARTEKELLEIKATIDQIGIKCLIFVGNVADEQFCIATVSKMESNFGSIDFMINNAGYGVFGPTEGISSQQWTDIYDVNVKGTFLFSKQVLTGMRKVNKGHIINVASDVAKRVFDGGSLYCSSKYAQDAFSAALRKEVRKDGIKVSVIYSGLVDTMFHAKPQGAVEHAEWLKTKDMADAIIFVMNQPKHVVIDELMIHPLSQEY